MSLVDDIPVDIKMNPFPGLRPFSIDESHLFFGREGQTDEVLIKLAENRFVGIIGLSGSGKSSFVYCGVLPILYGGFLADKGSDWRVVVMRPGASPIQNLAESLIRDNTEYRKLNQEEQVVQRTITSTLLKSSSLGLVESIKQTGEAKKKNFLILVDQFEELFRFRKEEENAGMANESLTFVNLLMEAIKTTEASIYVAITMRSDFIGDCAQFPELTKKINDSHYLIPQMTREQKRAAILGPVAVASGSISPRLVQQLLNDLGDKTDQLPILQHALMRTWDYWHRNREGDESMDIHHYEAIGSMAEALSQHANEAYEELNEPQKEICKTIFKALTEKRGEGDGIRRPTKLKELAQICRVDESEVIKVIDIFRRPGRSFLTPPHGTKLESNTFIDISHESLMRIWVRLKNWVNEEAESVQMYLRLADAAAMYQVGKAGLWRPPDLQLALNWEKKQKPTLVWGQRYHPAFERTMIFLDYSKREFETEQKAKEEEQRQKMRRARIFAVILGTAAVVCIGFLIYALIERTNAIRQEKVAQEKALEAQQKSELAAQKTQEAQDRAEEARKASLRAETQANLAFEAEQNAREQQAKAEEQAMIAQMQKDSANVARHEALNAKNQAEEAQNKAIMAARRADSLRYLSIAQAMAVKSLQSEDSTQKALLALQSFKFNQDKKGNERNPDIFLALYRAARAVGYQDPKLTRHNGQVRAITGARRTPVFYSAAHDGTIVKWEMDPYRPTQLFANENILFNSIALNANESQLVAGGDTGELILVDLSSGKSTVLAGAHSGEVTKVGYTKGDLIVSAGYDGKVVSWRDNAPRQIFALENSIGALTCSPMSPSVVIADDQGSIYSINTEDGADSLIINQENKFSALSFSHDGRYLVAGDETGQVFIWNTITGELLIDLPAHDGNIYDIVFDWNNRQMATASSDKTLKIWNLANINELPLTLSNLGEDREIIFAATFSPDNQLLFTGENREILVWATQAAFYADQICSRLDRNFTSEEWNRFVGNTIDYESTCDNLPSGLDMALKEED